MTVLCDRQLAMEMERGNLVVDPEPLLNPASVELTLGNEFRSPMHSPVAIDPMWTAPECAPKMRLEIVPQGAAFLLPPLYFALGHTRERVILGKNLAAQVDGKSSLGRLGLFVHATAGWVDPGWVGQLTLEFFNASSRSILLRPGMPISQLVVHRLELTPAFSYEETGRYQNSTGVVASLGVASGKPDRAGS